MVAESKWVRMVVPRRPDGEVRRRAFYAPLGAYACLMGSAHSAS